MANVNLTSIPDNINIVGVAGDTVNFTDFGGNDTYTLLNNLQGDVTIDDNNGSTINLPVDFAPSEVQFASTGVRFTINGFTVTINSADTSNLTFVFAGSPGDPSAGTQATLADVAAAYGSSVPASGTSSPVTDPGVVQADGTIGTGSGGGSGGGGSGGGGSGGGGTPPSSPGFDETILLTDGDDNEVSAPGANTLFQAAIGNLNDGDQLQGQDGDNDTLSAAMSGGESPTPTLSGIENIEVESLGSVENALNLDTANGVQDITVIDNGSNSAPLAITAVEQTSPTINLTGDEKISVSVKDDSAEVDDTDPVGDEINTTVDGFQGELHLANKIETVNMAAVAASAFDLSQAEDAFNKLVVSGDADTEITSAVSSVYDYTASTGNNTLVLTDDDPDDSVSVLGGAGDDAVDFTTTMDGVGENGHPNSVDGGSGNDQVWVELNTPIDVQPVIEDVEAIKLQFSVGSSQDATFSAADVGTTDQDGNPTYIIEESKSQVQLLDLASPALVEIIGDLEEGALFDAAGNTSITTRFVTETGEAPSIVVEGDLEYRDFDNVTIQNTDSPGFPNPPTGDGQGEVVLENQILLNDASSLTIETTREDDDDADNDGDIVVDGINNRGSDSAIGASQNLAALTVNAVNGNIFLGDGFVAEDDDALDDASALTDLTVTADNAIASIGDIGEKKPALNLENVNLTGTNRGVINLDDIEAAGSDKKGGEVFYDGAPEGHPYFDGSGALIEDFNVTTAERSFTSTDFLVSGQPIQVANDIDDLEAGLVRNMRLDIAEDGSLSFGEIETNITELNIFGAGNLYMFGAQSDYSNGLRTSESGERFKTPWFIEDIQADQHSGDIMLDFRDFAGEDEDFGSTDFEGTTNIRLGDQDTSGTGIRFDSYYAPIVVTAGDGNHLGDDDGPGDEFLGSSIDPSAGDGDNDNLPIFVQTELDDEDALEVAGVNHDNSDFFGITTGFKDDSVTTGEGSSNIYTGYGDDDVVAGAGSDIVDAGPGFNDVTLGESADEAEDTHVLKRPDKVGEGYDQVRDFEEGSGPDVTELYGFAENFSDFGGNGLPDAGGNVTITEVDFDVDTGTAPALFEATNDSVEMFEILFDFVNIDVTDGPSATKESQIEDDFMANIADNLDFSGYGNENPLFLVYDRDEQDTNTNAALLEGQLSEENNGVQLQGVNLLSVYQDVGFGNMETGDFLFT